MNYLQHEAAGLIALTLIFSPGITGQIPTEPIQLGATSTAPAAAPTTEQAQLERLGDLFIVRKRYLDAINTYQEAAGNSAVVWNKLGIAYQHLFNDKDARLSYEHSLRLDPRYPEALNNLGTIFYAEKDYKGAARYYNKALKLLPDSAVIYANLGTADFARGDYKRGVKAYRAAFAKDPAVFDNGSTNKIEETGTREERALLNFHLAKIYAQAHMNARALDCLREALDNGFHDRKKLMEDEELAELRQTEEFRKLLIDQKLR
jgi:tetratricopeptide (TPR) repeat protein